MMAIVLIIRPCAVSTTDAETPKDLLKKVNKGDGYNERVYIGCHGGYRKSGGQPKTNFCPGLKEKIHIKSMFRKSSFVINFIGLFASHWFF